MPIYEYECLKCHHRFELKQKFSDPPVTRCPEGEGKVGKLISPFTMVPPRYYLTDTRTKA